MWFRLGAVAVQGSLRGPRDLILLTEDFSLASCVGVVLPWAAAALGCCRELCGGILLTLQFAWPLAWRVVASKSNCCPGVLVGAARGHSVNRSFSLGFLRGCDFVLGAVAVLGSLRGPRYLILLTEDFCLASGVGVVLPWAAAAVACCRGLSGGTLLTIQFCLASRVACGCLWEQLLPWGLPAGAARGHFVHRSFLSGLLCGCGFVLGQLLFWGPCGGRATSYS